MVTLWELVQWIFVSWVVIDSSLCQTLRQFILLEGEFFFLNNLEAIIATLVDIHCTSSYIVLAYWYIIHYIYDTFINFLYQFSILYIIITHVIYYIYYMKFYMLCIMYSGSCLNKSPELSCSKPKKLNKLLSENLHLLYEVKF